MTATHFLPYGRQFIDDDDVAVVSHVLCSDFLTGGPQVAAFELPSRNASAPNMRWPAAMVRPRFTSLRLHSVWVRAIGRLFRPLISCHGERYSFRRGKCSSPMWIRTTVFDRGDIG